VHGQLTALGKYCIVFSQHNTAIRDFEYLEMLNYLPGAAKSREPTIFPIFNFRFML